MSVSAFADANLRRQLAELAKQQDRSVSAIVRCALEAEVRRGQEQAR